MGENTTSLDLEYKRYLQIMRPYLGQLVDEEAIKLCNAWIQRLSNCSHAEKSARNKYVFVLCYQLSKGILEEPFLNLPPKEKLSAISEISNNTSSSEIEYLVVDEDDNNTKELYNNNKLIYSDTELQSKSNDFDNIKSDKNSMSHVLATEDHASNATRKQTILCYTCPQMMKACAAEISGDLCDLVQGQDQYEYRANNLIMRLRDIKKQNMLLQHELYALKEDSKEKTSCEHLQKVNAATSAYFQVESVATIKSINEKLQSVEEDRRNLLHTLERLQDQIDNVQEIKMREIEDMKAKHKIEVFKIKSELRDENKCIYEEKLEQLRKYYEDQIRDIKDANCVEITNIIKSQNDKNSETYNNMQKEIRQCNDKVTKLNEMLQESEEKRTHEVREKEKIIQDKETELLELKSKLEDEKNNFSSILQKLTNKPTQEDPSADKLKAQELERRFMKLEKHKTKCIKAYEVKFANLQREKHLTDCTLQLQLARQRAQVVTEIANENKEELDTSLDKLEAKYKEIVANVQSTAIERRLQDEMTLNTLVKAACACGMRNELNLCQIFGKQASNKQEANQSCDSEISGILRNKTGRNKSYGDDSTPSGYCLNGEKFSKFLEKIYIPQKDFDFNPNK